MSVSRIRLAGKPSAGSAPGPALALSCALGLLFALGCESPDAAAQARSASPELTELSDLGATEVAAVLRRTRGRVVLVNLWSTWCAPCMEEMPMLIGVAERFRERGLGTAFVSMDIASSRAAALAFMREKGAPSPSYIRAGRDADFIEAIHPEWSGTLPATILFNAQRQAARVWVGEVNRAELERAIQTMLSERE